MGGYELSYLWWLFDCHYNKYKRHTFISTTLLYLRSPIGEQVPKNCMFFFHTIVLNTSIMKVLNWIKYKLVARDNSEYAKESSENPKESSECARESSEYTRESSEQVKGAPKPLTDL